MAITKMKEIDWINDMRLLKDYNNQQKQVNEKSKDVIELKVSMSKCKGDYHWLNLMYPLLNIYRNLKTYPETMEGVLEYVSKGRPRFKKLKVK